MSAITRTAAMLSKFIKSHPAAAKSIGAGVAAAAATAGVLAKGKPGGNPQYHKDVQQDFSGTSAAQPGRTRTLQDSPQLDADIKEYREGMAKQVPEADLESERNLSKWVADPEDSFNITPVKTNGVVTGGAHTQIPESPEWASGENKFGSLEYAWGSDKASIRESVSAGMDTLYSSEQPLSGVFSDVPAGAKNASEMANALRAKGFELFYSGAQPPLEDGKPSTNVQIFFRPSIEGQKPSKEDVKNYFEAYWSTFDSIDGDKAKLQATDAYKQLTAHVDKTVG